MNDGGEVEDYPVFITKGCCSGLTGLSMLCLKPNSQATSFSASALACLNCPSCEADYHGSLPAPELGGLEERIIANAEIRCYDCARRLVTWRWNVELCPNLRIPGGGWRPLWWRLLPE